MKSKLAVILLTLITGSAVYPQTNSDSVISNPLLVESFFDGVINDHLRSKHVAGAIVAVVKDGKLMFSKGYGYSDYDNKIKVSPDSTLFRIGSISKTFTWTAVMQLESQGKLDLDADINIYLSDFKIPEEHGGPITLRHLMTHTPGFEDRLIGIFAENEEAMRPYGEILKEQLPARVRPAGVEMSYSNHGTGIAAYIVEQVSGMPFADYVERYITGPLGMDHTTFRQPLPAQLSRLVSKGYNWEDGAFKEYGFEYVPLSAVGGCSSTAADMAKYMLTHLQYGSYNNVSILDSAGSARMQGIEFRVSPYVSGIGLGLYELVNWNGMRTLGHGGDTFWFHSLMALIPEKNIGLFVSFNTQTSDYVQVFSSFMSNFFPMAPPAPGAKLTEEDSRKFTGAFRFNRYPHRDLTKIISALSTVKFSFDNEGYLVSEERERQKWFPVNDSTFMRDTGEEHIVFGGMEKGRYTKAFLGNLAVMPLERVPAADSGSLHIIVLSVYMLVFLFTLVYWPSVYLIRKKYTLNTGEEPPLPVRIKRTGWITSFLVFFFFIGFAASLGSPTDIIYGVPAATKWMLVIPLVLCHLLLLLLYQGYRITVKTKVCFSGRLHFFLLTVSVILLVWQLSHWNMIGFRY